MLSTAQRILPEATATLAENRIDQASARLAAAFDRLENAFAARPPSENVPAENTVSLSLLHECAILREENAKLNHLLRANSQHYDELRQISSLVMLGLDESIQKVDTLLQS